jgi:uncharacterized protein DUF1488
MPLKSLAQPGFLDIEQEGVIFLMRDGTDTVRVLVSLHALEDIDAPVHTGGHLERFKQYRKQFEQIASDKFDRGQVEQDGTVCIRGRDLPGKGH